jgi:hypothetical protein
VAITQNGPPVEVHLDTNNQPVVIVLNPWTLLEAVKTHFNGYITQLRDPTNKAVRDTFTSYFDGSRATVPTIHVTMLGTGAKSTL